MLNNAALRSPCLSCPLTTVQTFWDSRVDLPLTPIQVHYAGKFLSLSGAGVKAPPARKWTGGR
jgi:hypothetical protein